MLGGKVVGLILSGGYQGPTGPAVLYKGGSAPLDILK